MKRLPLVVLVLALGAVLAGRAEADESPLAAAARKEQERRRKTPDAAKVITEADVRSAPASPRAEGDSAPADAGAGAPQEAASPAPDSEARRDEIQRELDAQAARIKDLRKQVDDAERELADAVGPSYGPRRAQVARIRDDGRKAIDEFEARIAELLAEARRLGVSVSRPE